MPDEFPVLIISGENAYRESVAKTVNRCGLRPVCCSGLNAARELLARLRFSAAFCSDLLPDGHFRDLLEVARKAKPEIPVIVVSRQADWDAYLKALGAGAFDYIAMPDDARETARILIIAVSHSRSFEKTTGPAAAAA
jgi:DNA-binding NtrC family response regulator